MRRRRGQGGVPREVPVMQAMMIKTRRVPGGRRPVQCPCFPFGAKAGEHRPRHLAEVTILVQQDQDQQNGRMEVIMEPMTTSSSEPLAAEDQL